MSFNTFIENHFTATRLEQQQHIYIRRIFSLPTHRTDKHSIIPHTWTKTYYNRTHKYKVHYNILKLHTPTLSKGTV